MFKYSCDKINKFIEYKPTQDQIKTELFIEEGNLLANQKVTMINNEWYYFKLILQQREILNELLGTYLASYIGLDTVKYSIGYCEGTSGLSVLSKNLKEKGYKYLYTDEIFKVNENMSYNFDNKVICDTRYLDVVSENLKKELLKLVILDMYMGQYDRHGNNIIFKQSNQNITLAPVIDYGYSFIFGLMSYCYSNPFLTVSMNENGIESFLLKYPFSYQTLYRLCELDIKDVLTEIGKIHDIEITNKAYRHYTNEESIKLLKKFK